MNFLSIESIFSCKDIKEVGNTEQHLICWEKIKTCPSALELKIYSKIQICVSFKARLGVFRI